jgi:outer membrane protein assembly complex protein YaeT
MKAVRMTHVLRSLTHPVRPGVACRAIACLALVALSAGVASAQVDPLPGNASDLQWEGKVIADVRPHSMVNPSMQAEKIMSILQTRPGKKFSLNTLYEDIRRLTETTAFSDIRYSLEPAPEGKLVVNFFLYEYPSVVREIVYQGAKHFKQKDLDEATGLRKGMPMSPRANQEACQKIMALYHEKGRMLARAVLVEGGRSGDTRVVFNITEGPKTKIKAIQFTGETFVTAQRLNTQIDSGHEWFQLLGGTYNAEQVDRDVIKLKEYYKNFGYHDVQISREIIWDEDMRHLTLIFHINEGPRFRVASIHFSGNTTFPEADLQKNMVNVKPGDYYNQNKLKTDIQYVTDYVGNRGYGTQVHDQAFYPSDHPGQVDIQLQMQERPPSKVGQIIIVGNEVTKQNVILRQIPLYPGQVLSYPDLRLAERNLQKLGIFENKPEEGIRPSVTVIDPDSDSEYKDLLVTVQETQTGSLIFGVGVNSNSGLTGSIVLNERNFDITNWPTSWAELTSGRAFRGAGEEVRIQASPGTQMSQYSATFREPYLFDSPYSFTDSIYYFQRFYLEYAENRVGTQVSLGRQLTPKWSVSGTIRLEQVEINNVSVFAPQDFQVVEGNDNYLVGFKGSVKYDTRDSFIRPTEGEIVETSFEEVIGTSDFPSFAVEFDKYFTTFQRADGSGKNVLAWRTAMGIVGSHTPVFERLYAGGFRSLRGFQFRGVGPNELGFMMGGDFMFLNSLEYQVPILANDNIYAVFFCDSGTVESSVEIRDYRVAVGFGLRFTIPMMGPMPIALDFGFPVVKTDTDRTQLFSFFVGFNR